MAEWIPFDEAAPPELQGPLLVIGVGPGGFSEYATYRWDAKTGQWESDRIRPFKPVWYFPIYRLMPHAGGM